MADIGAAVRAVLAADASVAALVSTRIYPDRLPQNVTYPAITYEINFNASYEAMDGILGLAESFVEVVCWSATRLQATALAEAVRLALTSYQGTSASVVVRRIHPNTGNVGREEPEDGSDSPIYFHERDFHAFYCEATS